MSQITGSVPYLPSSFQPPHLGLDSVVLIALDKSLSHEKSLLLGRGEVDMRLN